MTKFLIFNTPLYGHVNPTLAVVQELVLRGETVIYYMTEEFRSSIEATGAIFKPYTSVITHDWLHSANPFIEMMNETIAECRSVIAYLRADVEAEHADCILYDAMVGRFFTQILQLPAIQFRSTYAFNQQFNLFTEHFQTLATGGNADDFLATTKAFEQLCDTYQLPPAPLTSLFVRVEAMNIVFLPRILQPFSESFDERFKFVGPSIFPRFSDSNFPFEKLGTKPTLYISLGTIFDNQVEFVHSCFQAFGQSSWLVIQSYGRHLNQSLLGKIPENFLAYRHIPQLDILKYTDIFITHGGINSVIEALYYGVPLIMIPQMPEQALIAKQVVELGLGIQLDKKNVTSEILKEAVDHMITDEKYRINAQNMQIIMRNTGGYKEATNIIQHFVEK